MDMHKNIRPFAVYDMHQKMLGKTRLFFGYTSSRRHLKKNKICDDILHLYMHEEGGSYCKKSCGHVLYVDMQ